MSALSAVPELKKKIVFTLLVLLLYRFGTFVPIPGVDAEVLKKFFADMNGIGGMFGMVNLFSGGALERMSIFALNIMPYITASIVMQLLSSTSKTLEAIKKEGEYGRAKINQWTRYLTIVLAFFQSLGVYYALSSPESNVFVSDNHNLFAVTTCVSLVGGTVILMWLGEKITSSGIGNGISIIIFVGIISALPSTIVQMFSLSKTGVYSWFVTLMFFVLFALFLGFVCFVEKTYKRIKVQYANAVMNKVYGGASGDFSFLPLKVNISGVIPPIFASSILMFPTVLFRFLGDGNDGSFDFLLMSRGSASYLLLFTVLILFFSYFYSSLVFNSEDVANNLKKSHCFILGIRPGEQTAKHFEKVISRMSLIGGLYLVFVCIVPEILISKYSLPLYIGGTGILIVVNVVLDLINQVQSHFYANKAQGSRTKRRVRVRR